MSKRFSGDQGGATAIEYGLIAALIVVVLIIATHIMRTTVGQDSATSAPAAGAPLKH